MQRCELTDLLVEQCGHCRQRAERFDKPAAKLGPWFYANWGGECAGCGEEFEAGDLIRADGEGGYLADDCGLS